MFARRATQSFCRTASTRFFSDSAKRSTAQPSPGKSSGSRFGTMMGLSLGTGILAGDTFFNNNKLSKAAIKEGQQALEKLKNMDPASSVNDDESTLLNSDIMQSILT